MGVKAPGGTDVEALWSFLCAGQSAARPHRDAGLPPEVPLLSTRVEGFDPSAYVRGVERRRLDRCHLLAIGAAQDAVDHAVGAGGLRLPPPPRRAVVCGTGFGATATYESQHAAFLDGGLHRLSPLAIPTVMPCASAAHLALRFDAQGPCQTVSTACASGAAALADATELLRRGAADVVLAGGVDAMVTTNALASFLRLDAMSRNVDAPARASRPFDVDRDGFVLGEGAAFVVLERVLDARAADHAVLGYVLGHGSSCDAHHLVAPPEDGDGARRAMLAALDDAGVDPADVNHVNAHGTSTVRNDAAEAAALRAVFGEAFGRQGSPPVTATKGATGHLIGGSGALEAVVALWSLRRGLVPPISGLRSPDPAFEVDLVRGAPRALGPGVAISNAFGFGGTNTCLILAVP